jgi:carbamoyltransferase
MSKNTMAHFILGVNAYHGDSSACLVRDGVLVAAAEEERFRRIKHWAGFPSEAIRYVLTEAEIAVSDLNVVAVNQDSNAHLWRKIGFTLLNKPSPKLILDRVLNKKQRLSVAINLENAFPGQLFRGKVFSVEHHLAHLSSAYHVSPFDEAVAVSVDGFGDFASGAWGVARSSDIAVNGRVFFPHSLGIFYQALTQFLGFHHYGDEYKVMGLAPYGKPAFLNEMRQIVSLANDGGYRLNLDYFRHHRERVGYEWEGGAPKCGTLFADQISELLGPARDSEEALERRHFDLAHSVQAMYEEAFFHLLDRLHSEYRLNNLVLAGGCAMNSVANGKIYRRSPFKRAYIQSAAGDAGGAIGAAFVSWSQYSGGSIARCRMDHAYWGPQFSNSKILKSIDRVRTELEKKKCEVELVDDESTLCTKTASALSEGNVVGWFQGRMEWGPRALGNRSILGDPRRTDMKDILNLKIKRRESFRPFAPSILREAVAEWFEEDDDVPFMMKVFQVREEKRSSIPAVTHVDGSGRLQTVSKETNSRYYALISAFRDSTGVPLVLNTSFNENEPVVCTPDEALDCFLRTNMDVLVLGDYFVRRQSK